MLVKKEYLYITVKIVDNFAGDSYPSFRLRIEGCNLELRVSLYLLENILLLAGLNVQLSVVNLGNSERTHTKLVAVYCCDVKDSTLVKKITSLL